MKISNSSGAVPPFRTAVSERRSHARLAARGELTFRPNQGSAAKLTRGQFVDISAGGFRISHHDTDLSVGQELIASYGFGDLMVRIIWRHIGKDQVETGFAILAAPDRAAIADTTAKAKAAASNS